jgi:hypothetical protein
MKNPVNSSDPDMRGSWPALLRAAKRGRKLAQMTGTPFYVIRDGRMINLNPQAKPRKSRRS